MADATAVTGTGTGGGDAAGFTSSTAGGLGTGWAPAGVTTFDVGPEDAPFRVLVAAPAAPAPPEGYGLIVAMDAAWTFGTLRDVAGLLGAGRGDASRPTVIVGVGWPTDTLGDFERRGPDLVGEAGEGPGSAATLRVVAEEILPRVANALPLDPSHRMLAGHSFGGAFALRARAQQPGLFSHIAAGSPSIWTDPEGFFATAAPDGPATLIAVGEYEAGDAAEAAGADADRVERLRDRDMWGRAHRMSEVLGARFVEIPEAGHGQAIAPFLARAVEFLWNG